MRGQGGRVNDGQCRALRKSATVQKLKPEDFNCYDNVGDILAAPTRVEPGAGREAVRQGKLPDPALPEVGSPSVLKEFQGRATTRGSLTRSPTLAMVGGRCNMINNMEEVSSSSAQRAASPFKEVGWTRCSGLQRIRILCDVAKGRASDEQSPSPVTSERKGAGVTTRPLSTSCGPPHGHGNLDDPGTPPTSSSSL